jgi:hypothetical protein
MANTSDGRCSVRRHPDQSPAIIQFPHLMIQVNPTKFAVNVVQIFYYSENRY